MEAASSSNLVNGLRPLRPKDFEILVNLVDFSRALLTHKLPHLSAKWLLKLSQELILLSSRFPLISGFYKLATLCMRLATTTGYFSGVAATARFEPSGTVMPTDV